VVPTQNIKIIEQEDSKDPILKEGEELFIKMSNGQFRKIDEVVRVDDNQIIKSVPSQNNVCHKLQVPDRIAQEVGKIIEQHNGVLPRDISVRFVEKQANDITEQQALETQEIHQSYQCTEEHLVLFIKSHFYESRGIPVNITIDCSLEETEKELRSGLNSHFNRTLFVFLYIPLFFILFRFSFNEKDDYTQRELVRIYSSHKKSSKSNKRSNCKELSKAGLPNNELTESLIQKLLRGDQKNKPLITNDTITKYQANLFQEINENHNILIRIILKLFYIITGVSLTGESPNNSSTRSIKHYFEKFISKLGNLLQSTSCEELGDEASPNHDHLYSTDEASSSEADFVGPIPEKSNKGKSKKGRKEVKKFKYAS